MPAFVNPSLQPSWILSLKRGYVNESTRCLRKCQLLDFCILRAYDSSKERRGATSQAWVSSDLSLLSPGYCWCVCVCAHASVHMSVLCVHLCMHVCVIHGSLCAVCICMCVLCVHTCVCMYVCMCYVYVLVCLVWGGCTCTQVCHKCVTCWCVMKRWGRTLWLEYFKVITCLGKSGCPCSER